MFAIFHDHFLSANRKPGSNVRSLAFFHASPLGPATAAG
jgi:hypothetical protein